MVLLNSSQGDGLSTICKRTKVDGVRMDPKESDDDVVIDLPAPRKYPPPPRNLKDFPIKRDFPAGAPRKYDFLVKRDFPAGSRKQNSDSVSKNSISSKGKSIADSKQLQVIVPGKYTEEISLPPLLRNKQCGKVKEALNQYHKLLTELSQKREGKSIWQENANKKVHIRAATTLKARHKCVNTSKRIGSVPGVQIGDEFQWRAELCVIGLHLQFSGGIDYMNKDGKLLATSVVASGRYATDVESSDVLIYLGHGGNPGVTGTSPVDQKLERGNLALKNSMEAMTPVRVIRGTKFYKPSLIMDTGRNRSQASYVYDGLYFFENWWQERGDFGKLVFKFLLRRISGQQKLRWENASKSKNSTFQREGSYGNDIFQRKEKIPIGIPIPVVNKVDDKKPSLLNHIHDDATHLELDNISMPSGCDCTDGCSDSENIACMIKNGGEIPYNCNEHLVKEKPLIDECGPSCKCFTSCINRVSQRGSRFQLEVFETQSKGCGVRSRSYIPFESFVCEYVGQARQDKDAEQRVGKDKYLVDRGNNYEDLPNMESSSIKQDRNVGSFINHSCSLNLFVQNVLYDHDDKRMPHSMLFAKKDIPPWRELTYNYRFRLRIH